MRPSILLLAIASTSSVLASPFLNPISDLAHGTRPALNGDTLSSPALGPVADVKAPRDSIAHKANDLPPPTRTTPHIVARSSRGRSRSRYPKSTECDYDCDYAFPSDFYTVANARRLAMGLSLKRPMYHWESLGTHYPTFDVCCRNHRYSYTVCPSCTHLVFIKRVKLPYPPRPLSRTSLIRLVGSPAPDKPISKSLSADFIPFSQETRQDTRHEPGERRTTRIRKCPSGSPDDSIAGHRALFRRWLVWTFCLAKPPRFLLSGTYIHIWLSRSRNRRLRRKTILGSGIPSMRSYSRCPWILRPVASRGWTLQR